MSVRNMTNEEFYRKLDELREMFQDPERFKAWKKKRRERDIANNEPYLLEHKGLHKYKLSKSQFKEMREACDNSCKACCTEFSAANRPNIDHCHQTGKIRGLLCRRCNMAEGLLGSSLNAYFIYLYMSDNEVAREMEALDAAATVEVSK